MLTYPLMASAPHVLTAQALDYGKCIQQHADHVTQGVCSAQFAKLLACAKKTSKRFGLR